MFVVNGIGGFHNNKVYQQSFLVFYFVLVVLINKKVYQMSLVSTQFRDAFLKSIEGKRNLGRYGSQVVGSAKQKSGLKAADGWAANLRRRTSDTLEAEGIL